MHIIIPFRGQCNFNLLHLHPEGYNYIFSATPNRLLVLRRNTINNFAAKHCNASAAKHCSSLCLQSEGDDFYGEPIANLSILATCPWPSLRRSTVAHFACKVRGTKVIANLSILATCPWPSLCEKSELQCFAPRNSLIRLIR